MLLSINDYLTFTGQTAVANSIQVTESLRQAQAFAEARCDRPFTLANAASPNTHVYTFSGRGQLFLRTPKAPIIAVTLIEYWDGTQWLTADATQYESYVGGDGEYIGFTLGATWFKGNDNWRVTYTWGFATLPADLKRAMLMIAHSFSRVSSRAPDIKSQSDGEQSFTYRENATSDIPEDALGILDQYRRYW